MQGLRHWRPAQKIDSEDTSFDSIHSSVPDEQSNKLQSRSADQHRHRNASFAVSVARRSAEGAGPTAQRACLSAQSDARSHANTARNSLQETGAHNMRADLVGQQEWAAVAKHLVEAQPLSQRSQSMPEAPARSLPGSRKASVAWQSSALYSMLPEKAPPPQDLHQE